MPVQTRAEWVAAAVGLARPVLTAAAERRLRLDMPVVQQPGAWFRDEVTGLEAVARLLCGLAPWLETEAALGPGERTLRDELRGPARSAIAAVVDPESPDRVDFTRHHQPLVEAAFLSLAVLHAPTQLATGLEPGTRSHLLAALTATRAVPAFFDNWLLFPAAVELAIELLGGGSDEARIDYAVRQHEQWYVGDGRYADGPEYRDDYYDSIVIHPFLLEVAARRPALDLWFGEGYRHELLVRARRRAVLLERSVAPDGSFPLVGRSLAYRAGAFHLLARLAATGDLPGELPPGQVRTALGAVASRTLGAPGTFDGDGWLRIGVAGHQPGLGEAYISTGSLYLTATVFAPLGRGPDDAFWSDPPRDWTARRIWAGEPGDVDVALEGRRRF